MKDGIFDVWSFGEVAYDTDYYLVVTSIGETVSK
jgi:hypothetical protein